MADHASHEAIHAIAALVLVVGGALTLLLAFLDRRRRTATVDVAAGRSPDPGVGADAARSTETALRDLLRIAAVGLSLGAAAIHVAAAPAHVEELGTLGLGFYGAALFQAAWACVWAARVGDRRLAAIGIIGNLAISLAWLWSRAEGLPVGPSAGQPEAIGVPDATATLFQVLLVGLLVASISVRRGVRLDLPAIGRAMRVAVVPVVGVLFLASVLAVSTAAAGHDDGPSASHTTMVGHAP